MQIFVKTYAGKTIVITIEPYDTVRDLKSRILAMEGIPIEQQRLVFAYRQLEDDMTLVHYNIRNESFVHMIIALGDHK